jgi:hypothetical protein
LTRAKTFVVLPGLLLRWCLVDELAPHEQRSQLTIAPHATQVGPRLTIKEAIDLARIPRTAAV